ncbi:RpoN/RPB10 RNA polymerase subunit family protein [archaeon]|nr:RpoN/RPB10 RNA polymerase subunit family protein [archaeon]
MSCGKVVADKWEAYNKEVASGKAPKKALDELEIKRYCCRSLFLTQVDMIDNITLFKSRTIPTKEDINIENIIGKHLEHVENSANPYKKEE